MARGCKKQAMDTRFPGRHSGAALSFCRMFLTVSKNQSGIKLRDFLMNIRVIRSRIQWQIIGFLIL